MSMRSLLVGKHGVSHCLHRSRVELVPASWCIQRQFSSVPRVSNHVSKQQTHWFVQDWGNILRSTPSNHLRHREWKERRIIANATFYRACFSTDVQIPAKPVSVECALDKLDSKDERMINLLIKYKEVHGDCHVPTIKRDYAEKERQQSGVSKELVEWVYLQRKRYNKWQSGKLKRIQKADQIIFLTLESMGFMWSEQEANWQRYFNRLEAHKAKHGTLHVEKNQDLRLWLWADLQRKTLQREQMPETRLTLLQEIGFTFHILEAAWRKSFEELCEYAKEHGTAHLSITNEEHPFLAAWVARQRRNYQANNLPEERIRALESIGFSWDVREEKWEDFFSELVAFHAEHGHTRVPVSTGPLWHWVDRQRRFLRRQAVEEDEFSTESTAKIAALEKLNFNWSAVDDEAESRAKRLMDLTFIVDIHDQQWAKNYKNLCEFKQCFGHFSVSEQEHPELSSWVTRQRFFYNRDSLAEERVAALDEIGFAWTAQMARWDILYEQLVQFKAKHGHTRIPSKDKELYRWVARQRKALQDLNKVNNQMDTTDARAKSKVNPRMLALQKILTEDDSVSLKAAKSTQEE